MKKPWGIIASFFGIGFFPVAPGTVASLAVLLIYRFFLCRLPWPFLVGIFLALLAIGIHASSIYAAELGQEDPRRIVVDEAAGQLLVFLSVPPTWLNLGLGFFLFRFFDIVKPFPISRAERLPGGWGIMADDVAAAVAGMVILHLYLYLK
jgi:phosphatidylglycerophosphatase A